MRRKIFKGILISMCLASPMMNAQMPASPTEIVEPQPFPSDDGWWDTFSDTTLTRLVTMAEQANYDVAMAARRIAIARNTLASARSQYMPALTANAAYTKGAQSGMTGPVAGRREGYSYFSLGADMSWEIDVFGRVAQQAKGKKAALKASRADYAATMVSTASAVANAYFNILAVREELQVAHDHAESQKKVLDIVEARYEAGLSNKLEVSQSREVYYSTLASIPALETQLATGKNALAVLLGLRPNELEGVIGEADTLPDAQRVVATSVPADLLRRRPDIAAAEMQIDVAAASLGVARKAWLPSLTLTGSIGTSAHDAGKLFSSQSLDYSITPTLSWTIFDGLARTYNSAIAREELQNVVDSYNLTVLTAYQETDNAITSYLGTLRTLDALTDVVKSNEESLKLSVDLYKRGLLAYSDVATAQINTLSTRMQIVKTKAEALSGLVDVYKALGGGWNVSQLN